MSVMSEVQRRATPSRRFWPGSEKGVLWALTLLIGILSIAPLMRLVWAAMAPEGVPDISRLSHLLGTRKVLTATLNTLTIAVVSTLQCHLGKDLNKPKNVRTEDKPNTKSDDTYFTYNTKKTLQRPSVPL